MTTTKPAAATKLEALYATAGLPIEIDAGNAGLVVYGATKAVVLAAARSLARAPESLGLDVEIAPVGEDDDEPAATRFHCAIWFDWNAMPSSITACVERLAP